LGGANDGGAPSCSTELAGCGAVPVAVADVERALGHPDVVTALAGPTPLAYGLDTRPTDGTIFGMKVDGKEIDVGSDCQPVGDFCKGAAPAGVRALADLLQLLDSQELAKPTCATFPR
jgi:hypothetical protein